MSQTEPRKPSQAIARFRRAAATDRFVIDVVRNVREIACFGCNCVEPLPRPSAVIIGGIWPNPHAIEDQTSKALLVAACCPSECD